MSSFVYLLVWSPPPHIPCISSPNQCLLFAAHAHTIATCFAVISILYHLFLVFISTPYLELYLYLYLETLKCQGVLQRSGKSQGICVVGEICKVTRHVNRWTGIMRVMCKHTCSEHHITYLYFIHTLILFAYLTFSISSGKVMEKSGIFSFWIVVTLNFCHLTFCRNISWVVFVIISCCCSCWTFILEMHR